MKNKCELLQEDRRFLYVSAREEKQNSMNLQKRIDSLEEEMVQLKDKLTESEKQVVELKLKCLR